MSAGHFRLICSNCECIISQCRCMEMKRKIYGMCKECAKELNVEAMIDHHRGHAGPIQITE